MFAQRRYEPEVIHAKWCYTHYTQFKPIDPISHIYHLSPHTCSFANLLKDAATPTPLA